MSDRIATAPMPGAEDLAEPLRSRWSPSVFDDRHRLDPAGIAALLQAARWAPSAGNQQPWRFVVCERDAPGHRVVVPHLTRGNSGWVPRASAVLLAATKVAAEEGDEKPTNAAVNTYGLGQAVAHLTLQAHAMGLWVHQFAGFDKEAVATELGVPDAWAVIAAVAVGTRGDPADVSDRDREREHRVRDRLPLPEIAYGDAWGAPWRGASA